MLDTTGNSVALECNPEVLLRFCFWPSRPFHSQPSLAMCCDFLRTSVYEHTRTPVYKHTHTREGESGRKEEANSHSLEDCCKTVS
jgi:hypothetical protein